MAKQFILTIIYIITATQYSYGSYISCHELIKLNDKSINKNDYSYDKKYGKIELNLKSKADTEPYSWPQKTAEIPNKPQTLEYRFRKLKPFGDPTLSNQERELIISKWMDVNFKDAPKPIYGRALFENFSPDRVLYLNGSLGIFQNPTGLTFAPVNLPKAYLMLQKHLTSELWLGTKLLDQLRSLIMDNEPQKLGELNNPPDIEYKTGKTIIGKVKNVVIHPEVASKIQKYGYKIETDTHQVDGKTTEVIAIDYGSAEIAKRNLEVYVKNLNQMIKDHLDNKSYTVEEIVTYAVQEFLIIHPYKNGNGRLSRVIGQAVYEFLVKNDSTMSETVFFPKEFYQEMQYSYTELVTVLRQSLRSKKYDPQTITNNVNTSPQLGLMSGDYSQIGSIPIVKYKKKLPSPLKIGDTKFGSIFKSIAQGEVEISPSQSIISKFDKALYFGAPFKSVKEALARMEKFFEKGRDLRPFANSRNIDEHVKTKKTAPSKEKQIQSAFIQTTSGINIALGFARSDSPSPGAVFVIDGRGADLTYVKDVKKDFLTTIENEYLFDSTLDPRRVIGAFLTDNGVPYLFIENPNYDQQFVLEKK